MITDTSKETHDKNQDRFNTDKANVLCFLVGNYDPDEAGVENVGYTASQIAENTAVSYRNTMSRLTDLQNEGKVKVTGKRTERGRRVQTYQYDPSGEPVNKVTDREAYELAIHGFFSDHYIPQPTVDVYLNEIILRAKEIKSSNYKGANQ